MTTAITIRDVADKAGVDQSTASRVLNGRAVAARISAKTSARVQAAARALQYSPNFAARALRERRTWAIGLLLSAEAVHDLPTERVSVMSLAADIEEACAQRGYSVTLMRHVPANDQRLLNRVASRAMDGLILTGWVDQPLLDACRQHEIPCVDVWGTSGRMPVCAVESDLVGARLEAVRYAAEMGHKRIAIACRDEQRQHDINRALLTRVARDPKLRGRSIGLINMPAEGVANPGEWLFKAWRDTPAAVRPTLIMAHEQACVSFIGALSAHGLRCPADVSVIALNSFNMVELVTPALTGISVSPGLACRIAVELLVNSIESGRLPTAADSPAPLPCQLITRQSVAPPAEAAA